MIAFGAGFPDQAAAEPAVRAHTEAGDLVLRVEDRPLLTYRHIPASGLPDTDPLHTRSGYLHPLHAPGGAAVTGDFPADHLHQRGVFFAWTKTEITAGGEALQPDFWNLAAGSGRVRSISVAPLEGPGGVRGLRAVHAWDARRGARWDEVLRETWDLRLVEVTGERDAPNAAYVLDLTSRQVPRVAFELPVYRYGGFCIRGPHAWIGKLAPMRVLTSEGKERDTTDAAVAKWVDMSGPVDGKPAGVALLDHPANLGYPNQVRLGPDLPYFMFSPQKTAARRLEAGKEHVFRYRIVAHNGYADAEQLNALWKRFSAE